jgi:hypothetical protein
MGNPIVKYTKAEYEAKIEQLDGCIRRLQSHEDTLNGLKDRVRDFWDDPQTLDYLNQLTKAIVGVRNARNRTDKLLTEYKSIVEEMEGVTAVTTGLIEDIGSVIGSLGISGE